MSIGEPLGGVGGQRPLRRGDQVELRRQRDCSSRDVQAVLTQHGRRLAVLERVADSQSARGDHLGAGALVGRLLYRRLPRDRSAQGLADHAWTLAYAARFSLKLSGSRTSRTRPLKSSTTTGAGG